jgi:hypothetical protein
LKRLRQGVVGKYRRGFLETLSWYSPLGQTSDVALQTLTIEAATSIAAHYHARAGNRLNLAGVAASASSMSNQPAKPKAKMINIHHAVRSSMEAETRIGAMGFG